MSTLQTLTYWTLVILLIVWVVAGFVWLFADELARLIGRRKRRKQAYARDHFRQTERFRNSVD